MRISIRLTLFLSLYCLAGLLFAGQSTGQKVVSGKAGPILHKVQLYTVFNEIPASWTIPKFKSIAKPKPAPNGHVWYVLRGTATNNGTDSRSINITTYKISDKAGNSYKADVRNSLYQPEGTGVASITVDPGATQKWIAFYPIPLSAQGLILKATDLTFVPDQTATFDLLDPAAALTAASGGQTRTTQSGSIKSGESAKTASVETDTPKISPNKTSSGQNKVLTAKAGAISHTLGLVEVLKEIPKSYLTERWKSVNKSAPAPAGHVWYHLQGQTTNGDSAPRTILVESITIVDADDNVYETDNGKIMYYADSAKMFSMVQLKPGETKDWMTYIAVPTGAKGLKLRLSDLRFMSKNFDYITLPNTDRSRKPS